jgi:hypothetical protein
MALAKLLNKVCLACLIGTLVADAQQLRFGFKGGVTALDQTRLGKDESKAYVVGGSIERRLFGGFAVEANLLYRRHGVTYGFPVSLVDVPDAFVTIRSRANILEAPVMGKYYFRRESVVQPFALTGYSFRKGFVEAANTYSTVWSGVNLLSPATSSYSTQLDVGAVWGGGVQWKAGRFSVAPELRFTRWGSSDPRQPLTRANQLDLLFGIRF